MKKLFLLLPLILGVTFASCGEDDEINDTKKEQTTDDNRKEESEENSQENQEENNQEQPGEKEEQVVIKSHPSNIFQSSYLVSLSKVER